MNIQQTPLLDNTMGALLLTVVVGALFVGICWMQAYEYFTTYGDDQLWLKLLVSSAVFLDTLHQGLITHLIYTHLITWRAEPQTLSIPVRSIFVQVFVTAVLGLIVRGFFIRRIWKLSSKSLIMTGPVVLVVLGEFGSSMAHFAEGLRLTSYTHFPDLRASAISLNVTGAVADAMITFCLVYLLTREKRVSKRMHMIINNLIIYPLTTGIFTSICAILSVIFTLVSPNTFIFAVFYCLLSRFYANSLLATLNARKKILRRAFSESLAFAGMEDIVMNLAERTTDALATTSESHSNDPNTPIDKKAVCLV